MIRIPRWTSSILGNFLLVENHLPAITLLIQLGLLVIISLLVRVEHFPSLCHSMRHAGKEIRVTVDSGLSLFQDGDSLVTKEDLRARRGMSRGFEFLAFFPRGCFLVGRTF